MLEKVGKGFEVTKSFSRLTFGNLKLFVTYSNIFQPLLTLNFQ